MRQVILLIVIAVTFYILGLNMAYAATKCEGDGRGGICCWNTDEEGTFKPIACS